MSSIQIVHEQIAAIQAERRQFHRLKAAIQAELRVDGSEVPIRVETADISEGGCYIEMPITLTKGASVQVVLWVGGEKLSFPGRVVTSHPQFGNGLEFHGLSPECKRSLGHFLDGARIMQDRTSAWPTERPQII